MPKVKCKAEVDLQNALEALQVIKLATDGGANLRLGARDRYITINAIKDLEADACALLEDLNWHWEEEFGCWAFYTGVDLTKKPVTPTKEPTEAVATACQQCERHDATQHLCPNCVARAESETIDKVARHVLRVHPKLVGVVALIRALMNPMYREPELAKDKMPKLTVWVGSPNTGSPLILCATGRTAALRLLRGTVWETDRDGFYELFVKRDHEAARILTKNKTVAGLWVADVPRTDKPVPSQLYKQVKP